MFWPFQRPNIKILLTYIFSYQNEFPITDFSPIYTYKITDLKTHRVKTNALMLINPIKIIKIMPKYIFLDD